MITIPEDLKIGTPDFGMGPAKVFAITGFFSDKYNPELTAVAFGGYFRHTAQDKRVFDGQLIDRFGPSQIEGKMDDGLLEFEKYYQGRRDTISYRFTKQNGIWVGAYDWKMEHNQNSGWCPDGTSGKTAQCMTFPAIGNGFDLFCGPARRIV